jgi:hypothetical protein
MLRQEPHCEGHYVRTVCGKMGVENRMCHRSVERDLVDLVVSRMGRE